MKHFLNNFSSGRYVEYFTSLNFQFSDIVRYYICMFDANIFKNIHIVSVCRHP